VVENARPRITIAWPILLPVAAVSLVTMPLTAIWFLLLGLVALVISFIFSAVQASPRQRERTLSVGGSSGLGLLVGPLVYLTLAVVT
jgi:hypothetical protein